MAVEEYSNVTGLKKVKSRYGCSVCPKKVTNGTLIVNSSSINLLLNKKNVNHNDTNSKYLDNDKSKIKAIISEPKVNDCYCNHMEEIKKKLFPKVLCSKRFKIPVLDIDEDWLNEISKFRRENWFDCHSDTFTDAICLKNINSSSEYIFILTINYIIKLKYSIIQCTKLFENVENILLSFFF